MSSTPGSWTPTRIARGTGGLVSMMRLLPISSDVWRMPSTFRDGAAVRPLVRRQEDDCRLSRVADWIQSASPRRAQPAAPRHRLGME